MVSFNYKTDSHRLNAVSFNNVVGHTEEILTYIEFCIDILTVEYHVWVFGKPKTMEKPCQLLKSSSELATPPSCLGTDLAGTTGETRGATTGNIRLLLSKEIQLVIESEGSQFQQDKMYAVCFIQPKVTVWVVKKEEKRKTVRHKMCGI